MKKNAEKAKLMVTLGPKCYSFRASGNEIEMQLRVDPGAAWLTIKRPGCERSYRDIPDADVAATVEQFLAIGEDPEKFKGIRDGGGISAELQPRIKASFKSFRLSASQRLTPTGERFQKIYSAARASNCGAKFDSVGETLWVKIRSNTCRHLGKARRG